MAAGDILELRFHQNWIGSNCINVFHFEQVTGLLTSQSLIDYWMTNTLPLWRPLQTMGVTYQTSFAQTIWPVAFDVSLANPPQLNGAWGAQDLPQFCAVVVQKKTGLAGRSKRGRFFMAGFPENAATGGLINTDMATQFTTFQNGMFNQYCGQAPASGFRMVVLSKQQNKQPVELGPGATTPVVEFKYVSTIGVQRRRKLGVGT